jgi:predicted XRE-type DNA-binding protein
MKRKNSPTITPELAGKVKYLVKVLGLFQHQAAAILGINQGRVSEVMTGKRFPKSEPVQTSFSF